MKVHGKVVRFIAADINDLLGVPGANVDQLRQLIVTPTYAHIRHLLCDTRLAVRWTRQ